MGRGAFVMSVASVCLPRERKRRTEKTPTGEVAMGLALTPSEISKGPKKPRSHPEVCVRPRRVLLRRVKQGFYPESSENRAKQIESAEVNLREWGHGGSILLLPTSNRSILCVFRGGEAKKPSVKPIDGSPP